MARKPWNRCASFAAVAALLGVVAVGCSSASTNPGGSTGGNGGNGTTTGGGKGSGTGTGGNTGGTGDTTGGAGDDGGGAAAAEDQTVGTACTSDAQCDVTGRKINRCSSDAFNAGTLDPAPVCIGTSCDPGDGTQLMACDGGKGACLQVAKGGVCMPACTFLDDGAAPKGCVGKNACNILAIGTNQQGQLEGVGFCFGGCTADADCTGGNKCDLTTGVCLKTVTPPTKKVGDTCTSTDTACNCLAGQTTKAGYCTQFCVVGGAACATGFVCSAQLPKTTGDGGVAFTKQPQGIAGSCLKTCKADADCTALGAKCDLNDVTGGVCVPQ